MINNATGENVNTGGTWNNGVTFTKSFNTTINASWVPANCNLQVFVYKSQGALNMSEIQQGIKNSILMTGAGNQNTQIPVKYELSQNYPNPFNPVTNIKFAIPVAGNVSLKVYDMLGRLVEVYMDGFLSAGYYNAEIDGTKLTSGVYFYSLNAGNFKETMKMLLVK
jgi:hypothetical protein